MNETVTERAPCTECGTPHDACVGPDYCCDECLHLDANWDGYEQPEPARPVGGHTREALREEIARSFAPKHWPVLLERHRDRLRARADVVLALPSVRDALAAQEKLRRVRKIADDWTGWPGEHLPVVDLIRELRRALAGES